MDYNIIRAQSYFKTNSHLNLFPVKAYNAEYGLFWIDHDEKNSYIGLALVCTSMCNYSETKSLVELADIDFPKDSMLSVQQISSKYVAPFTELMSYQVDAPEALKEICEKRNHTIGHYKDTFVVVSAKIPATKHPSDEEFESAKKILLQLETHLNNLGMAPTIMDHKAYLVISRVMFQSKAAISSKMDYNQELYEQVLNDDVDIVIEKDHFKVNNIYGRHISVDEYGEHCKAHSWSYILGEEAEERNRNDNAFILSTHIIFTCQERVQKENLLAWDDEEFPTRPILKKILNGERAVYAWTSVMLFGDSIEALDEHTEHWKNQFNLMNIKCKIDVYMQGQLMQQQLLMALDYESLDSTSLYTAMTYKEVTHFIPVINDYKGNGFNTTQLFVGYRGQIVSYDNYSSDTNKTLIVGNKGYDQIYITYDILERVIAQGRKVIIMDSTGELKQFADAMKKQMKSKYNDNIAFYDEADFMYFPLFVTKYKEQEINRIGSALVNNIENVTNNAFIVFNGLDNIIELTKNQVESQSWSVDNENDSPWEKILKSNIPILMSAPNVGSIENFSIPMHTIILTGQNGDDAKQLNISNKLGLHELAYKHLYKLNTSVNNQTGFYLHNVNTRKGGFCKIPANIENNDDAVVGIGA